MLRMGFTLLWVFGVIYCYSGLGRAFTLHANDPLDSIPDDDRCGDGPVDDFPSCNLRSAFETCSTLQSSTAGMEVCTIYLADGLTTINLTLGPIVLKNTTNVHITSFGSSRIEPVSSHGTSLITYRQAYSLSNGPYLAISNIKLSGFNGGGVNGGVVHFNGSGALQITNVSFTHNRAESGGSIFIANNEGGVRIENCTFINNTATTTGGAVAFGHQVVNASITGSFFTTCEAQTHGGCIFVDTENSGITISGCRFSDSTAIGGNGGAVALSDRNDHILIASSVCSNTSAGHGGGVSVGNGNSNVTLTGLSFQHCESQHGGGAIALNASNHHLTIAGCSISDCHVLRDEGEGGGIYAHRDNQHLQVTDTNITDSSAYIGGGISIEQDNTYSTIQAVRIQNCSAKISGGGIFSFDNKNLTIVDTAVGYSRAYRGGGVHLEHDNDYALLLRVAVHDCRAERGGGVSLGSDNTWVRLVQLWVTNCVGSYLGGGVHAEAANNFLVIDQAVIVDCRSMQGGALLLGRNEMFTIANSVLRGCRAEWGGAVMLYSANLYMTFLNVTMTGNQAKAEGGAIYSTQYGAGLRIGGCTFTHNTAQTGRGGAMFVESGNDLLLILDSEAVREMLIFESEHPYAYAPVIFRQQVNVPGAVGYLLFFDPQSSIGNEDSVTVCTAADCSDPNAVQLFKVTGDGDWPGKSITTIQLDVSAVTLEMTGSSSSHTPETSKGDNFYGFRACVVPIFPPDSVQPTIFSHNSAGAGGGALAVFSSVRFAIFLNNQFVGNRAGGKGGALLLRNSLVGLTMQGLAFRDNQAGSYGGAVCGSSASYGWNVRDCTFVQNLAVNGGGALAFLTDNGLTGILSDGNSIDFTGCQFSNNSAAYGGGIYLAQENAADFHQCVVSGNNASSDGGGIYMQSGNRLTLEGCRVSHNSAGLCGGAVSLTAGDGVVLNGSQLLFNTAGSSGGGICSRGGSSIELDGEVQISGNKARYVGGAVASFDSPLWTAITGAAVVLDGNKAQRGSAVYLKGVTASASGSPARRRLGAAVERVVDYDGDMVSEVSGELSKGIAGRHRAAEPASRSRLDVTYFTPGGMAPSSLGRRWRLQDTSIGTLTAVVTNNRATVGGTVYWLFDNTTTQEPAVFAQALTVWEGNSAPYGVYFATQAVNISATIPSMHTHYQLSLHPAPTLLLRDHYGQQLVSDGTVEVQASVLNPSPSQCHGRFPYLSGATMNVRNTRSNATFTSLKPNCAPGGKISLAFRIVPVDLHELSAEEQAKYVETRVRPLVFRNCSRGEYISSGECVTCANGTYSLEYPVNDYTKCLECSKKRGVESCRADELKVKPGYWRRHDTSYAVLECIGGISGCAGGYATGAASCEVGYEGPLCGVCANGYYSNDGVCETCSGSDVEYSTTTMVFLAIAAVILGLLAFVFYAKCIDGGSLDGGDIEGGESRKTKQSEYPDYWPVCCTRTWIKKEFNRMQAQLKIVITTYQIVSAIPENMNVTFPSLFNSVLNAFSVFNLNVVNSVPFTCSGHFTYIDTLVFKTLFPIGISIVLFLVAAADAMWQTRHLRLSDPARLPIVSAVKDQYLMYFFFLTYLVLPSVATTIFQTFLCTNVDPRGEDSDKYDTFLIADMSISCTSQYYYKGVAYAVAMVVVYVVGIPLLYFIMLYNNRQELLHRNDVVTTRDAATQTKDTDRPALESAKSFAAEALQASKPRKLSPKAQRLSFLWEAYEPQFWYWEVVETTRRLVLTAVLSVCGAGTSAQSILAVLLGVLYIKLYGFYRPYVSDDDDVVAEVGQFQIFYSFLGALIYQNELLGSDWNNSVGIVLILINAAVTMLFTYYGCRTLREEVEEAKELLEEEDGPEESSRVMPKDGEGNDDEDGPTPPETPVPVPGADRSGVRDTGHDGGPVLGILRHLWPAPAAHTGRGDHGEQGEVPVDTGYASLPQSPAPPDRFLYEEEDLCESKVIANYF